MIKLATVVGTRPQFIKAAALSRAIKADFGHLIQEKILHTGQHYDFDMSEIFFQELGLDLPEYHLNIGSGPQGSQTAAMIEGIEQILTHDRPDYVLVYGDTNSTLAASLAAAKMGIPLIHVEAGMRSHKKTMPEEINRIVSDHCSTLLFTPTKTGLSNLRHEGIMPENKPPFYANNPGVFHCGDLMYDNALYFAESAAVKRAGILSEISLKENAFILATIHRQQTTDDPERLASILSALLTFSHISGYRLVFPVHPRTRKMMEQHPDKELTQSVFSGELLLVIPPVSYFEMLVLEKNCRMVITDSGGVQREAYFFGKPSIITRNETEWKEIIDHKCGILIGTDKDSLTEAYKFFEAHYPIEFPPVFGDGQAGKFICREIVRHRETCRAAF